MLISEIEAQILTPDVVDILLKDRTTGNNILWATDAYSSLGEAYSFGNAVTPDLLIIDGEDVIKPRCKKTKDEQSARVKDKAEVFTPSWVCNEQNNLIDKAYIGRKYNTEKYSEQRGHWWEFEGRVKEPQFPRPNGVTFEDYVSANRIEITCGEAPYLTSRYDTVTGKYIKVKNRIGLLDRKLRLICRTIDDSASWLKWAEVALRSIYGFEWQGDNLYLARVNLLMTVVEHYREKFGTVTDEITNIRFAEIIVWNVFQMDGIKFVIPETCHDVEEEEFSLFGTTITKTCCPGCKTGAFDRHNGIYAKTMDWQLGMPIEFKNIVQEKKSNG